MSGQIRIEITQKEKDPLWVVINEFEIVVNWIDGSAYEKNFLETLGQCFFKAARASLAVTPVASMILLAASTTCSMVIDPSLIPATICSKVIPPVASNTAAWTESGRASQRV